MRVGSLLLLMLVVIAPLEAFAHPPVSRTLSALKSACAADVPIPAEEAVTRAEGFVGKGARAQKINLIRRGGRPAWALIVAKGNELTRVLIDTASGTAYAPAHAAKPTNTHEEPPVLPTQLPLHDAIIRGERAVHGRALAADLESEDGTAHFTVELDVRCRKVEIEMDADSGKLLPQTDEDAESDHD